MLIALSIAGILIIAVLAVIAYRLQKQVDAMEAKKATQQAEYEKQQQEKRDSMNRSIQILAQGLLTNQVTKTEAAIRIGGLLEFLEADEATKEEFSALFQLAQACSHIPILEKWKALPTKEKMCYDNERLALEEKYGDFVMDAAKRIIGREF